MFEPVKIAPSILSADFMNMERDIRMIEAAGADWVHVDVMDGHFVPNLTIGPPFAKQLGCITDLPLDVHLMISNPAEQLDWYLEATPHVITVHYEAFETPELELPAVIDRIHEAGVRAAVSLKPDTPTEVLDPYLPSLDMVLMMSVYPGFSGQSYISGTDTRIASVVSSARCLGCSPLIQVDGGMSPATAPAVCGAGADVLVMGSACFGADDPAQAIKSTRDAGMLSRTATGE